MSSLRFVERNGKMILQQSTSGRVTTDSYGKVISDEVYWQDVPVHKEPEGLKYIFLKECYPAGTDLGKELDKLHRKERSYNDYPKQLSFMGLTEKELAKCIDFYNKHHVNKEPEAPKKPREFWVNGPDKIEGLGGTMLRITAWTKPIEDGSNDTEIHFTEVPKGYKLISRAKLIDALLGWNTKDIDGVLSELGFSND